MNKIKDDLMMLIMYRFNNNETFILIQLLS